MKWTYDNGDNVPINVTDVIVKDGVKQINSDTFRKHKNLVKITIPESVSYFDVSCFSRCTSLISIQILSSNVTQIETHTFDGCTSLKSLQLPCSIHRIGDGAFRHCKSLESLDLPSSLLEIGRGAFNGCMMTVITCQ